MEKFINNGMMEKFEEAAQQRGENTKLFNSLFQLSGIGKVSQVFEYLKWCLEYPEKYVVFCHHKKVMESLCKKLTKLVMNNQAYSDKKPLFTKIDGSSNDKQRKEAVDMFQTPLTDEQKESKEGGCRIILLSITSASEGLNLTESSTVIFAELYWTPKSIL